MADLSQWDLIEGGDIFHQICTFHSPTLREIRKVGYGRYLQFLNLLSLDLDDLDDKVKAELPEGLTMFMLLVLNIVEEDTRELLRQALSFFISGKLYWSDKYGGFLIDCPGRDCEVIDNDNYRTVVNCIRQLNYLDVDETAVMKTKNKKVMEIMAKLKAGRKKMQKAKKADVNLVLPNLISAVVAYHGSYTFENVWSLTVYQLHDLFFRLNTKFQLGIVGQKWAAWGTEDFDFSTWYKAPNTK